VPWESGGIPSCGNSYCRNSRRCNVLLTLLLLLLLQLCATPVRGAVTLLHNTFLQLLPEALVVVVAVRATPVQGAVSLVDSLLTASFFAPVALVDCCLSLVERKLAASLLFRLNNTLSTMT
jgi:hypothetical protein